MIITAIKQQVKNPDRVSIYIDGKYSFSLNIDQLLEQKLKVSTELSDKDINNLVKFSVEGKLRARTLEWLLSRPHSTKELKDYLNRKKAAPEFIETLIDEFTQKQYLNDAKFANWWIETRRSSKNYSARKIKYELAGKGISSQITDGLLADGRTEELRALKRVIAKKSKLLKYQNDRNKFIKYLIGQGFNYSDIKKYLSD